MAAGAWAPQPSKSISPACTCCRGRPLNGAVRRHASSVFYGTTSLALPLQPDDWKIRLFRAVFWFIPRASPDHDPLYPRVRRWVLELDDTGLVTREIGLDEMDRPLFGAPDARNHGYFTDSGAVLSPSQLSAIDESRFEALWSLCNEMPIFRS